MKTTLIALFKAITEAEAALIVERDASNNEAHKKLIRQAIKVLDQLANDVLILDLNQHADQIEAEAVALVQLTQTINNTSNQLANVAQILNSISDKLAAVLQATTLLSSAGLIA